MIKIKQSLSKISVKCIRCNHGWIYSNGIPMYRIRCPACHSTKNELNRKTFGKWKGFEK